MTRALLLLTMLVPGGHAVRLLPQTEAQTASTLVRVYVSTAEAGDADDVSARRESVKDLRAALGGKKQDLVLVDTEREAEVVIDVIDRGVTTPKVVFRPVPAPGQDPAMAGMSGMARDAHLRVSLTHGAQVIGLSNKDARTEASGGWRYAADDVAKQIEKWIGDHRAAILKDRGTGRPY